MYKALTFIINFMLYYFFRSKIKCASTRKNCIKRPHGTNVRSRKPNRKIWRIRYRYGSEKNKWGRRCTTSVNLINPLKDESFIQMIFSTLNVLKKRLSPCLNCNELR